MLKSLNFYLGKNGMPLKKLNQVCDISKFVFLGECLERGNSKPVRMEVTVAALWKMNWSRGR